MVELRQLSRESVESLVWRLTSELSNEQLAIILEETLRLPRNYVTARTDPTEVVMEVFDAVSGVALGSSGESTLAITDICSDDGRVAGTTHTIPAGAETVYAVFENKRRLKEVSHVFAVWRNLGDDRLEFAEAERIHSKSHYNYVWLEVDGGWPSGRYCVELFDPAKPSLLLASKTFHVR